MEDTIRKVSPGYKVTTFRAGGYLVEPFEKLRAAFYENGIKTDSSVCPNLVNDDGVFSYDFRFYPNIQKYKFELSPKDNLSDGSFYEVPITTVKIPVFTNMLFILIRMLKYSNLEIERKGSGTGEVFQSNRILNYKKILSLFRPRITQLTTDSNFKERFSYLLKKVPDYSTMILHPKLLNHHTLGFLHDYVSTNKIRFISIQEFLTKSIS
jgi:hypothetical protein